MDDPIAPRSEAPHSRVSTYHGLLGTVIELRVTPASQAGDDHAADEAAFAAAEAIITEITRLQGVFSVYETDSVLVRWRSGILADPGPELTRVLDCAHGWHHRSRGVFNPASGTLTARWRDAEAIGAVPEPGVLAELADRIRSLPYGLVEGSVQRLGDCSGVDLNAIAKGHIVDRALDAVPIGPTGPVAAVTVNAGGDLAHRGVGSVRVGVENPLRPYDNEPPLRVISLSNAAVATSGGARRGFHVGGHRYSHVLDPRTGWPVDRDAAATTAATVIAPDATTADAVATVVGVLPPAEALAFVADLDDVACLLVSHDGSIATSSNWPEER